MTEDKAHQWTDKKLALMEAHISRIYEEAQEGIDEKLKAFTEKFEKQSKEKLKALAAGKIDDEEYKRWMRTQVYISDEWKKARAMLADEYAMANKTALAYINGETPEIYSVGYNAIKTEAESKIAGYSFHLLDKNTVKLLTRDNRLRLPPPTKALNVEKDKRWNVLKINSELRQGILQGESIGKIADRMQKVTDMNRKSALRNARTMATCAENSGRMQSYADLEARGCTIEREWIAALDKRTRHAHQALDGERRKKDESFVYDGDKIMYPGDPTAKPYLVYNCRCTIAAEIVAYHGKDVRTSFYQEGQTGGDTTAFEKKRDAAQKRKGERAEKENLTFQTESGMIISKKKFGKKIGKHAMDYGLDPNKEESRNEMIKIIDDIFANADEVVNGEFRGQKEELLFYIKGEDVVIAKKNKEFVTIMKGGVNNARVKDARNRKV